MDETKALQTYAGMLRQQRDQLELTLAGKQAELEAARETNESYSKNLTSLSEELSSAKEVIKSLEQQVKDLTPAPEAIECPDVSERLIPRKR